MGKIRACSLPDDACAVGAAAAIRLAVLAVAGGSAVAAARRARLLLLLMMSGGWRWRKRARRGHVVVQGGATRFLVALAATLLRLHVAVLGLRSELVG